MSAWSDFWDALEKSDRCKYCTSAETYREDGEGFDGDGLPDEHIYDGEILGDNVTVMLFEPQKDEAVMEIWIGSHLVTIPINYCPICGRQLSITEEVRDGAHK